jgi:hypothetical protein
VRKRKRAETLRVFGNFTTNKKRPGSKESRDA